MSQHKIFQLWWSWFCIWQMGGKKCLGWACCFIDITCKYVPTSWPNIKSFRCRRAGSMSDSGASTHLSNEIRKRDCYISYIWRCTLYRQCSNPRPRLTGIGWGKLQRSMLAPCKGQPRRIRIWLCSRFRGPLGQVLRATGGKLDKSKSCRLLHLVALF